MEKVEKVNKNKKVSSSWKKVETCWPALSNRENISFNTIKGKMGEFLIKREVFPRAFSHFGFVVNNIEKSIEILKKFDRRCSIKLTKEWVEAYKVYVGRIILSGKELEFIEPVGESFFNTFLSEKGEGLHHLAFQVNKIDDCFKKLKTQGVELIDKEPRSGSHGKVVFLIPGLIGKMCIELFQKYK